MSLANIKTQLEVLPAEHRRHYWRNHLLAPHTLYWVEALRQTMLSGDKQTIIRYIDDASIFDEVELINPELPRFLKAQLQCALSWLEQGNGMSSTLSDTVLKEIAEDQILSIGQVKELSIQLAPRLADSNNDGCKNQGNPSISLPVLLFNPSGTPLDRCILAELKLERVPGLGDCYPVAESMLTLLVDDDFRQSIVNARQWLKHLDTLATQYDVRWRLRRYDNELLLSISGPSLGGAFALGLACLLSNQNRYRVIDLDRVSITAQITNDGSLIPVGGVWDKVLGEQTLAYSQRHLLHTVVVADSQKGIPNEYLQVDAQPLRVLKAANLDEAITLIRRFSTRQAIRDHERNACKSFILLNRTVALADYYQVLPLMQMIEKHQLPSVDSDSRGAEDSFGQLRPLDILRWEGQELSQSWSSKTPVTLAKLFADFQHYVDKASSKIPRLMLIGPPGCGKTTFIQYLSSSVATGELGFDNRPLVPARIRLADWARQPGMQLSDYLATYYRGTTTPVTADQWQRWLFRGDVLLLLDGLDEVEFTPAFREHLLRLHQDELYRRCPLVMTCRTVSFEQHRDIGGELPVFTLTGLTPQQQADFISRYPARYADQFAPQTLIDQLCQTPPLQPLASNPLLLSILCFVVDAPKATNLPTTRCQLYERVVTKLLDDATNKPRVEMPPAIRDLSVIRKRLIIERVALSLFTTQAHARTLTFDQETLLEHLTTACAAEGRKSPAEEADGLLVDFTQNSSLLRGSVEHDYIFLHLTVQEFLAAARLARIVNQQGWEADVSVGTHAYSTSLWFLSKSWDPRWRELIILWIAQVDEPTLPISLLIEAEYDSYLRHLLALAGEICTELTPAQFENMPWLLVLMDRIALELLNITIEDFGDTRIPPMHLLQAFRKLMIFGQVHANHLITNQLCNRFYDAQPDTLDREYILLFLHKLDLGGFVVHEPLLGLLTRALASDEDDVRTHAVRVFEINVLSLADNETFLILLGDLLTNEFPPVREIALSMMTQVNPERFFESLVQTTLDKEERVRKQAGRTIEQLGAKVDNPDFLRTLATAVENPSPLVRCYALEAIAHLGTTATNQVIQKRLGRALLDEDAVVSSTARQVYVKTGITLARMFEPIYLTQLFVPMLSHDNLQIRQTALKQLPLLGTMAVESSSPFRKMLISSLHKDNELVRSAALNALGELGSVAAIEPFIGLVKDALMSENLVIRRSAMSAIFSLGWECVNTEPILSLVTDAIGDQDRLIRKNIITAIYRTCKALPKTLEPLCNLLLRALQDTDPEIKATAIYTLGVDVVNEPYRDDFIRSLTDEETSIKRSIIWALQQTDQAASSEPFLNWLTELALHEEDWYVSQEAFAVLRSLGDTVAQEPHLRRVAEALSSRSEKSRRTALSLITYMGSSAATEPILNLLAKALKEQDWLVRFYAFTALRSMKNTVAEKPFSTLMLKALRDDDETVRMLAISFLPIIATALPQDRLWHHLVRSTPSFANPEISRCEELLAVRFFKTQRRWFPARWSVIPLDKLTKLDIPSEGYR